MPPQDKYPASEYSAMYGFWLLHSRFWFLASAMLPVR
jgi:hypothetical protein